jgi:hypothetical protein
LDVGKTRENALKYCISSNKRGSIRAFSRFFPVFFPVMGKSDLEHGSLWTASTAIQDSNWKAVGSEACIASDDAFPAFDNL